MLRFKSGSQEVPSNLLRELLGKSSEVGEGSEQPNLEKTGCSSGGKHKT